MDYTFTPDGWLRGAIIINAEKKTFGITGNKWAYVVLHGTAGFNTAQDVGYFFRDDPREASTHFIVGKDGVIVQCARLSSTVWGNGFNDGHTSYLPSGNPNMYTISIEHVKNNVSNGAYDNSDILTPAQAQASFNLVNAICNFTGIPKQMGDKDGGIIYHHTLDNVNKMYCPGPYPEAELLHFINNGGDNLKVINFKTKDVNLYFTEKNANTWTCNQTKKDVHGAILEKYMRVGGYDLCGLTDLGLPLSNEIDISKTDTKNIKHYAVFQVFERGILIYDPDGVIDRPRGNTDKTYKAHIDSDLNLTILELHRLMKNYDGQLQAAKDAIAKYNNLQTQLDAANATVKQLEASIAANVNGSLNDAAKAALNDAVTKADALVSQLRTFNAQVNQ